MKKHPGSKRNINPTFVLTKSYDDGEILLQKNNSVSREEYVVQCSITDIPFEEYVVANIPYVAPNDVQQSIDVNLFYTPSQTYSTSPNAYPEVVNPASDKERLSLLDNITQPNNTTVPREAQSSSFEYLDLPEEVSISQAASEDNFEKDIEAILAGKKVFNADKKVVERASAASTQQPAKQQSTNRPVAQTPNEHAIFDQIAESMEYAKAYDLGSIDLEKRFSDFDQIMDIQKVTPSPGKNKTSAAAAVVNSEDFIKDLDAIARAASASETPVSKWTASDEVGTKQVGAITVPPAPANPPAVAANAAGAAYPPRPSNIRPYSAQERAQLFGTFPYEPDPSTFNGDGIRVTNDWRSQNIAAVSIPQLNGKLMGSQPITNGSIQFHRSGATALQNLWNAWQAAGLLDRILNFQGGYAARYIRHSQSRSPRPLSNHAWGTAFDINADWNGFGMQPALVGTRGCVRDLIATANMHGFFWGGHFRGSQDGMHFELGKIL